MAVVHLLFFLLMQTVCMEDLNAFKCLQLSSDVFRVGCERFWLSFSSKVKEHRYVTSQLIHNLRNEGVFKLHTDPCDPFHMFLTFLDASYKCPYIPPKRCLAQSNNKHYLNAYLTDIRKSNVVQIYSRQFGYNYSVDPTTYKGDMVRKATGNALHYVRIIKGPIPVDQVDHERYVYQRLLRDVTNNTRTEYEIWCFRTSPHSFDYFPIRAEFPFTTETSLDLTYEKAVNYSYVPMKKIFTGWKLDSLVNMLNDMCADLVRIDVVFDKENNIPVVLDVNDTPTTGQRARAFSSKFTPVFEKAMKRLFMYTCIHGYKPCKPFSQPAAHLCSNSSSRKINIKDLNL